MNEMSEVCVHVVVDRDYKVRILGLFSTYKAATEHADKHNGEVFSRFIHDVADKRAYVK